MGHERADVGLSYIGYLEKLRWRHWFNCELHDKSALIIVLRLAYLSSSCIPSRTANSIHVMKMCSALARSDHEVVLFMPDKAHGREPDVDDVFGYYGVKQKFTIQQLPWARLKGRGYWYGWQAARRVWRGKFDLVLGRNLAACYFSAYLGMPVIYEAHSPIEDYGKLARCMFSRLICLPSFKHLVVITEALRQHFQKVWPELRGRIVVAPDGADPLEGEVKAVELARSEGRMQVGYAGHLYTGKGAELVLELARCCTKFDFHIVGGTDAHVRRWFNRGDLPKNLQLHGHQPHAGLPSYLVAFDVVLLPNQPEVHVHDGTVNIGRWTSPLKLFEYMAAGRPIICSDVAVLKEVAEDGVNMLVCRHDVVAEWAAALDRLAEDDELRWRLGATARKQLELRYTWDERARCVLGADCR